MAKQFADYLEKFQDPGKEKLRTHLKITIELKMK